MRDPGLARRLRHRLAQRIARRHRLPGAKIDAEASVVVATRVTNGRSALIASPGSMSGRKIRLGTRSSQPASATGQPTQPPVSNSACGRSRTINQQRLQRPDDKLNGTDSRAQHADPMQRPGIDLRIMIEFQVGFVQKRALEPADAADKGQLNVGTTSAQRLGDCYRWVNVSTGSPSRDHHAHPAFSLPVNSPAPSRARR